MNERELVTKAQAGDYEAFTELINAHKSKIYALAWKLTGNAQDTEDIVQETFLRAIDKIDSFRLEASFGTWLYTIALNLARAQFAKAKQAELKPLEDYLPAHEHGHLDADHPTESGLFDWKDPAAELETARLRESINEALNELPYKYREAFILRYFKELSVKEVAEMTGESVASAKSRILRARLALRDSLSKKFKDSYDQRLS
jgi:RNA polymerase sigma-70 factor (ECF subfamily)